MTKHSISVLLFAAALCSWPIRSFAEASLPPPLMLASVYRADANIDLREYWVSEKLDGVRAYWNGYTLLTRSGRTIDAPPWFTAGWPNVRLDGELWAGRGRFEEVSALVRTQAPPDEAWRHIRFMAFDLPEHGGPFSERVAMLKKILEQAAIPWLRAIPQFRVTDHASLEKKLREIVAQGGEGLMLHRSASRYRAGRSEDVLKYKLHDDAEAKVVGHLPGQGKYENMLGALLVERPDGVRFRIGTGFTDEQRADPPPVGSWVTYAYSGLTRTGKPRFARFVRVREEE